MRGSFGLVYVAVGTLGSSCSPVDVRDETELSVVDAGGGGDATLACTSPELPACLVHPELPRPCTVSAPCPPLPVLPRCTRFVFPHPDPSGPPRLNVRTCEPDVCGVNGMWLGNGVPFRILRLDRTANPEGIQITKFRLRDGTEVVERVDEDSLVGTDPTTGMDFSGYALEHAVLTLRRDNPPNPSIEYLLTIEKVDTMEFLAECPARNCTDRPVPIYHFTAVTGDGCPVQLCRPGLVAGDKSSPSLTGKAVIFKGDRYNENFTVTPESDEKVVNFACLGTNLSKLHLLRHTPSSQTGVRLPDRPPTLEQRTALMKLLAGDYCGDGDKQHLFTLNGTPISLEFHYSIYQPTCESGYSSPPNSIDASWDEHGATCLDTPRLNEPNAARDIKATCLSRGKVLPPCSVPALVTSKNPSCRSN